MTRSLVTLVTLSALSALGRPATASPSLAALADPAGAEPPLSCPAPGLGCPLDKLAQNPGAVGTMDYRYVPLCEDGSGDHEWTLGLAGGTPPTCLNAPERQVRCVDGTRALYYYDRATANGADLTVDKWVFFDEGGTNCAKTPRHGRSIADNCGLNYFVDGSRPEMTSASSPPRVSRNGILAPAPRNGFARYNRIYPLKCTFDKFMGDRILDTSTAYPADPKDCDPTVAGEQTCRLYFQGRRLWRAMLWDLSHANPALPDLGSLEATTVLFTGNSNGASGLTFLLDDLAAIVRATAPAARVLGALDDHFSPALETETVFGLANPGADNVVSLTEAAATGLNEYNAITSGPSEVCPVDVDASYYEAGGNLREQYDSWWLAGRASDASCRAAHSGADLWQCYNEEHVLHHHVTTPVFLHQTLLDTALTTKDLDFCDAAWTAATYKPRILYRMGTYLAERDTAPALGDAEVRDAYPFGVFMRNAAQHVNLIDNTSFFNRCLAPLGNPAGSRSYHTALWRWTELAVREVAIEHGWIPADQAMAAPCPP